MSYICTREQGSSVSIRTGPGANYPKGLVMVGSGGQAVANYFENRNYTVPDGELLASLKPPGALKVNSGTTLE